MLVRSASGRMPKHAEVRCDARRDWLLACQAPRSDESERPYTRGARSLRRYAVSERVGVKIGVITQTRPGTVLFRCSATLFFSPFAKSSHELYRAIDEKRPVGALQMLHQHVAGSRVAGCAWHFAQHFFQLLAMTRSRAIIRDRHKPSRLSWISSPRQCPWPA